MTASRLLAPDRLGWLGAAILLLAPSLSFSSPVAHLLRLAPTGEGPGDQFGIIVGGPGDLNGDGFADIVIDGFLNDAGGPDAGRAYVYFGGSGLSLVPGLILTGEAAGDNFGVAKGAGDVNGDGYRDLIVGSNQAGSYPLNPGKAYLYLGGPAMSDAPDRVFVGEAAGDLFGSRVTGVGDANGDDHDDVIIGAIGHAAHGNRTGRAYLYFGGPAMDSIPDLIFTGEGAGDEFGLVGGAGDVNGDGCNDVIIGAWLADPEGWWDVGRAYLYYGGPAMDDVPDRIFTGQGVGDRFGVSVMGSGDVNDDGFADLIVGAYWNDAAGLDAGRAYVYFGGPSMDTIADVVLSGEGPDDGFGKSVCDAGDIDADGYADVIVGAYTSDAGGHNSGRAQVFYGGPTMDAAPDMTITGEASGDQLGYWVSNAGDVRGDGFADVIIGASFNDAGGTDAGRAYLVDFNRYFVESPNGGETWVVGAGATVSWRGAEPADVWLSMDGGATFERLQAGVGGKESNSMTVQVPDRPTSLASIKITPANLAVGGQDQSDAPFRIAGALDVGPGSPARPGFAAPWPNPATDATQLTLELPDEAWVTVRVFDVAGRLVATPVGTQRFPAGRTTRAWRPGSLRRGMYHLHARFGAYEQVRRLVWLGAD